MITKIGLGSVQFGIDYGISNKKGRTSLEEVGEILNIAKNMGIDLIDTAYGYGKAEEVLGNNDIENFKVVSKFLPPKRDLSITSQLNLSLKRLNKETLYGYLAHRPLDVIKDISQWEELNSLKTDGLVKKIGFSFNTPNELRSALDFNLIPDLVQVPFNYFDNRFINDLQYLKSLGCEVHTRSPFLQGLFFVKPELLSDYFNEIKSELTYLQSKYSNLNGYLLRYCLEQEFIDKVIIGVENSRQFSENIESIDSTGKLPIRNNVINEKILMPSFWPKKK